MAAYQAYQPPPGAPPGQQYGQPAPGGQAPPQGPPPQQQQYQQQPYQQQQYPQQQGNWAPPPGPPPGQYTQQQQQQAPAGGSGSSFDVRGIESVLQQAVQDQGLAAFYPPGSLGPIAQRIAQSGALDQVAKLYRLQRENAIMLAKLALFDVALLLDDSGSMAFTKWNGERLDDLNLIVSRVATTAALFDADGISVRFLNSSRQGNNLKNEQDAMRLLEGIEYKYQTPLGGALRSKILEPMLLGPAEQGRLTRPILCILVTDGEPSDGDLITRVIKDANQRLKRTRYGPDAFSLQIAQVGTDIEALEFLARIDADPQIGNLVDCTSNFESEADEMKRKTGNDLTPEGWMIKLLMGAIDSSHDQGDEAQHQQQQYGGGPGYGGGAPAYGGGAVPGKKKSKFGGLFGH